MKAVIVLMLLLAGCATQPPEQDALLQPEVRERPEFKPGLGELCTDDCEEFCAKNGPLCDAYCESHPENEACSRQRPADSAPVDENRREEQAAVPTEHAEESIADAEEQQEEQVMDPRWDIPPRNYSRTVTVDEPLILRGNQELLIEDTHYIIKSSVVLKDNAKLIARNAFIDHEKEFSKHNLDAYGNSKVILEDVELRNACTGGLGWNFLESSSLEATGVQQKDCNIWVLTTNEATTTIKRWDWFGGTTCDTASTTVEDSENLEIELCNTQGADMDIALPATIDEYEFSGKTVPGMKNRIVLKNVTIEGWGVGANYGDKITIRDGHYITISFGIGSPYKGKTVVLDDLGRKHYKDRTWKVGKGHIRLVNTTMYGWETMVWSGGNTLIVRNSNFTGPTMNSGDAHIIVENSTLGAAAAFEDVRVEIRDSVITGPVIAYDGGKIIIRGSTFAGAYYGDSFDPVRIAATESGSIELINTPLGTAVIAEDNGRIRVK